MLLICIARVSTKCIKIRSAHDRSGRSKDCICSFCAQWMREHPEQKNSSEDLASILKGPTDAKNNTRRTRIRE